MMDSQYEGDRRKRLTAREVKGMGIIVQYDCSINLSVDLWLFRS